MLGYLRSSVGLLRFLYTQRLSRPSPPGEVGLDEDARREFLGQLRAATGYLEFGSGGSTVAAAGAGVRTVAVEGDPIYARVVQEAVKGTKGVEVVHVDIGLTREWSKPVFTWPTQKRLRKWRNYVEQPFSTLTELGWFPDFIFVDGRFRRACVLQSARQAMLRDNPVTIMVDDYFTGGREHYRQVEQWLGRPKRVGRAALFAVMPGAPSLVPSTEDVEAAAADYR